MTTDTHNVPIYKKKIGHRERTYQRSHPWIRFELPVVRFPPKLWVQLGEARSKCEHLAGTPLKPHTADKLHQIYLAKGVLATTAIEGNTLSFKDVEAYLDGTLKLPPSKEYLKTEIENIVRACNLVIDAAVDGDGLHLDVEVVKKFNQMVLDRLDLEPEVTPGQFRQHDVRVAKYPGAPWQDCPFLVDQLTSWLDELSQELAPELGTARAILMAVMAHLYLAWIHPFGDGNGRTARLMEFAILVQAGIPVPAAHLLSDHYNETRTQYYRELDRASASGGDVVPFICYAIQGLVDGLRAQISAVKEQQLEVAWTNYVHEQLPQHSEAARRRLALVFALSRESKGVRIRDAMRLTGHIAQLYAKKTKKTLSRDINELRKRQLVVYMPGARIKANTALMRAFLPSRARVPDPA